MSAAIEFNNVSKQYRLGLVSTGTLSHDLQRFWAVNIRGKEDPYLKIGEENDRATKGNSEYVWALRDIDFKVEQGDVVGIIGKMVPANQHCSNSCRRLRHQRSVRFVLAAELRHCLRLVQDFTLR